MFTCQATKPILSIVILCYPTIYSIPFKASRDNEPTKMPLSSRPQTLKQAKRAYRKSGAIVRLSASELAQAERRAALQERADRIREREARRKANLKKREEKIARERETAKRMGRPIAEDKKSTWKIGASQLSLGGFLGGVQKRSNNILVDEDQEDVKAKAQLELDAVDKPLTCTSPPSQNLVRSNMQDLGGLPLKEVSPNVSAIRMPPPSKPQPKSTSLADEAFDDCFPSNSQIERELSPHANPAPIPSAATLQARPSQPTKTALICNSENADDLLACISTQDLDFSGGLTQSPTQTKDQRDADILAQISTQDLDFEDEPSRPAAEPETIESDAMAAEVSTQDLDFSDDYESEEGLQKCYGEEYIDFDIENQLADLEQEQYER